MCDQNPIFQIPVDKRGASLAAEAELKAEAVDIFDFSRNSQFDTTNFAGDNPYLSPSQLQAQQNAQLFSELSAVSEEVMRCRQTAIARLS